MRRSLAAALVAGLALATTGAGAESGEKREAFLSIDVKEASVVDIVRLLAEVGGFQVVFHPGPACRMSLKLEAVAWPQALDSVLRACRLAYEEEGGILRVASPATLTGEAAERRRFEEAKRQARPQSARLFRLSYARAERMAPLVKRFLSERGEVVWDARTNTLIVID